MTLFRIVMAWRRGERAIQAQPGCHQKIPHRPHLAGHMLAAGINCVNRQRRPPVIGQQLHQPPGFEIRPHQENRLQDDALIGQRGGAAGVAALAAELKAMAARAFPVRRHGLRGAATPTRARRGRC